MAKDPRERPRTADIIEYCRSRAGGRTAAVPGSWLPAAMAVSRYRARRGTLQLSRVVAGGSYELRRGGSIDSKGPLSLVESPMRYSCSGDSMREFPEGGEVDLSRIAS